MAVGYAHTRYCDHRGCRAKVTVESTRNAAHARRAARIRHGSSCNEAGDFCPTDRAASATTSPAIATRKNG
ncbi:hypothetical protein [Streptomyces spiralis]|uniref:hypothetical protein n=1 Tax=Streptomyces spiralis TaxID=66376 RepID=UPI0033F50F7A